MAERIEAYVDTSALIAFGDRSDTFNPLFRRLFADPPPLVTTSLVVAEGHGWFLRRYDAARAMSFLSMLEDMPFLKTLAVGADDIGKASAMIRKFSDQHLTMTDAVGLTVMRDRKSAVCWSTDRHLGLTGIPLVIHQT